MGKLFREYATPLTAGLFLVSLVSGVALFFHVGGAAFHGMHEWLSLLLILPFGLHIWRNWRATTVYFRGTSVWIAFALSLAGAVAFAYPALTGASAGGGGRPPQFALAGMLLDDTVAEVAPILELTPATLSERLKAAGFAAVSADAPLREIASASGRSERELSAALLAAAR